MPCLVESIDPSFTFGVSELQLAANQTRSIDVRVDFGHVQPGHEAASFADFVGGADFLLHAIQAAVAGETGITVQEIAPGVVRVTFHADASTTALTFDVLAVDDGIDEKPQDFRIVIENEQVTSGAEPGTVTPGEGTSYIDSKVLDIDEYQIAIADGVAQEGQALDFAVTITKPSDKDIVLDLEVLPAATANTNPATPGVDVANGHFQYSVDGGHTWLNAAGPNGTLVTIPAGSAGILVRVESYADVPLEGDESFILSVRNKDALGVCNVTNVVDGFGYIFDNPPDYCGPTYFIKGPPCLVESVDPSFTFGVSDLMLSAGQTRSIEVKVDFTGGGGKSMASFDDFVGGDHFLFNAIKAAADLETGISVTDLGNGAVRVTFAANASTTELKFDVLAVDDGIDEPVEHFNIVLGNEVVTGGAPAGTIVPGEGTSFVESKVLDPDEYQVTISDAVAFEGDSLVFDISLSHASDKSITLELKPEPFATIDTSAAKPGSDFESFGFEFSTDGGVTWQHGAGANGRNVTFMPGETELKVRIETFTDGIAEGDESFKLSVANLADIGVCNVTKVVDGYGYIFDTQGDNCGCPNPKAPDWYIAGPPCLIEEVDPTYTLGLSELMLQPGQTRSIDVSVEFTSFHTGHGTASFADLGGPNFLFNALNAAAQQETGITVENLGNGAARVTFAANASTNALDFDIFPVADNVDEPVEDFRIVLNNSTATGGAEPAPITFGPGTSFVESHIVESDEYMVSIGNAQATEGDPLVFEVNLSNPHTDESLTLDLGAVSGSATAGVDFEAFGFEYSTDGGATWKDGEGPDGRSVTFAPGETSLLVRIETFPDSFDEGRENFRLTVTNADELGPCDVSGVEDGKGVIIDAPACEPPPPPCEPPPCDPPPCEPPPPKDCEPPKHHWTPKQDNHGSRDWTARGTGATNVAVAALAGLAADRVMDHQGDEKRAEWNDGDHRDGKPNVHHRNGDDGWQAAGHDADERRGQSGHDDEGDDRGSPHTRNGWDNGDRNGHDSHQDSSHASKGTAHETNDGHTYRYDSDWSSTDGNHASTQGQYQPSTLAKVVAGAEHEIVGTPGDDHIRGTNGDDVIYAGLGDDVVRGGAGNDLIVGGGGADILRGGAGDDTLVAKAGFALVDGGAGYDTFKFDDSGVLDLSTISGRVTGIEKVDITGTGNVELKLSFQDVLNMTDDGHQLTIVGNAGDKVSADFSGHDVAVHDMGAFTRYVVDGGAATVDIDNHVTKNVVGI